jgi:alanyl-tRNA synthetase
MNTKELKKKYLDFFKKKGHAIIPSAPLIPEHDPTVLFTTAGMHPLVPFLMGQKHPLGKKIANVQKCIRTQDIDEVGDSTHTTFFEMLGNWSLGDYFKKEAIEWSYEFLTKQLKLDPKRLAVSCFKGDKDAPKDEEAASIWKSLGMPEERITFLPKSENWWGPAGSHGPCGPDTEMFYWKLSDKPAPKNFDPEDDNWVEIWNDVFMQYNKTEDGKFIPLNQKNVDTGLGVERVAMVLQGKENIFEIEVFMPIIEKIKQLSKKEITNANKKSFRIIADHIKAATFILGDERGVPPSNLDQGYILRRYIRRTIRHLRLLGVDVQSMDSTVELAKVVINIYKNDYPLLKQKQKFIFDELKREEDKFQKTLDKGLREFEKMTDDNKIDAKEAFLLYQSYGFPIEMIEELAEEKSIEVGTKGFQKEYEKHQELSRKGAEQRFKGGLSDSSEQTTKLHTATHLLGEAIRKVLKDDNIRQKGSNITPERLRYDFNFDRKLTAEEKQAIEDEVNNVIGQAIEIKKKEMPLKKALESGAQAEFGAKYPDKVTVYTVGDHSKEICMGPHVENTKELGHFKIKKEESSAAGIRRIKAILD